MSDDITNISDEALQTLLDEWLDANPESPLERKRAEANTQINRALKRLKAALEDRLGRVLSNDEFKALLVQRLRGRELSNVILELDEWAKELEQAPAEYGPTPLLGSVKVPCKNKNCTAAVESGFVWNMEEWIAG